MSDFKPHARIKDTALLAILKLEYDSCEITGATDNLDLHHVILKSGAHRGDDLRQNIICLEHNLHMKYHRGDLEAMRAVARHVNSKRTDVAAYISEKLGSPEALLHWFERHGFFELEEPVTTIAGGVDMFCPDCHRILVEVQEDGNLAISYLTRVSGSGDLDENGEPDEGTALITGAVCLLPACHQQRLAREARQKEEA